MKCNRYIKAIIILGTFLNVPSIVSAKSETDSLLMNRIYNYQQNYTNDVEGFSNNIYMKWRYNTVKRNFALWLIPHMYSIAKGSRSFIYETYSRLEFKEVNKYDIHRQLVCGTIPHYSRTMPTIQKFMTPNLYDETIYSDHILSPFHKNNRRVYKYEISLMNDSTAKVVFTPRSRANTQLVEGNAVVDRQTGRIVQTTLIGEFDMVKFRTESTQGHEGNRSLLPTNCKTDVEFKFMGNHITSTFEAAYDCPVTLPDSINIRGDREMMDTLRPIGLVLQDKYIYEQYDKEHPKRQPDTTTIETAKKKHTFRHVAEDIGDQLVSSLKAENEKGYVRLSPLINPQYLSYSPSKGVAYKMKLRAKYAFNAHRYFEFKPNFGYNFKQKRFYFTAPLRFTYNPKRDGYVEVEYGNGNRIGHSSIVEEIEHEHGDTLNLSNRRDLSYFKDNHFRITNNIMLFDWIDIETGFVFHRRQSENPAELRQFGKPSEFRSFAPAMAIKVKPWENGPVYTLDYERGIKGVNHSTIDYERWEFDASMKIHLKRMRTLNTKFGFGFYTRKNDNYFVDFTNFRDNNLPEAWDDDWTGNFQLLSSRWYNTSRYYVRHNLSYESPLLFATRLPVVGKYIERERLYLSTLSIDHTRLYNELGYGFTNRYFSIGLFASFLNVELQDVECKFTIELFRRW